jgi:hypothetical protein
MKALLFILLLLLISISPSLTAPPQSRYNNRQRIIYTVFTRFGVFHIQNVFDPRIRSLVTAHYHNTEITPPAEEGFQRVTIAQRTTYRWMFNTDPPTSISFMLSAVIEFTPRYHRGAGLPAGALEPGITVIDPHTLNLQHLTFRARKGAGGRWGRASNYLYPLAINFVFMTVLAPSAVGLDEQTERTLREQGIDAFLPLRARTSPGGSSSTQLRQPPPLQLDPGIWIHLLTNRMSDYQPGAIECQPAPETLDVRPDPEETCSQGALSGARPREPDDPGPQGGAKRPCVIPT